MKVQSINSYYANPYLKNSRIKKQQTTYSHDKVSFGHAGIWDQFKLGILQKSDAELKELAKYFYNSTDSEIREAAIIRNFFGLKKDKKSEEAYKRLRNAVKEAAQTKESLELLVRFLKSKKDLTEYERRSLDDASKKLADFNNKFEGRKKTFYIEENLLSQDDIDYFNRHDNDY